MSVKGVGTKISFGIKNEDVRIDHRLILAHWNGRFGNRMHQYAYGATYARVNNAKFLLPSDWEGTKLFKNQYHTVIENDQLRLMLNQSLNEFHTDEKHKEEISKIFPGAQRVLPESKNGYDLNRFGTMYFDSVCAYHQNIYTKMSKEHLLDVFEFSDEVKETEAYKYWSSIAGTYDIAHLRRDDISNPQYNQNNHQGYSVISQASYYNAFLKFGYNPEHIIWISDDYIGKWHYGRKQEERFGWSYPVGSEYRPGKMFDWLEDFLKIYFARTVFRANSSFSWWASFLSPTAKVYSPVVDKRLIYGVDGEEEIDVEFTEGNENHWMFYSDEPKYIMIR